MNILITGGAGNVGRGVVAHLLKQGHTVRVIDRKITDPTPGVDYADCDITDFAALREQIRGMEGVIHLAAYPHPAAASGPEIYRVNCAGTYNVFEAAAAEGVKRVACASSINALGYNFGIKSFPIHYFPIDEEHPTFTTDPYSFSKHAVESIAAYYWRREGIISTCLRMPYVYSVNEAWMSEGPGFINQYRETFNRFLALPVEEQQARVAKMFAGLEEARQGREFEKPWDPNMDWTPDDDMLTFYGYTDFWSIISVEDAAQAFEKSLLANFEGSHPLYITECENFSGVDSETLLSIFFPAVAERRKAFAGTRLPLVSYEKAQNLIGFEPQFLIRERF